MKDFGSCYHFELMCVDVVGILCYVCIHAKFKFSCSWPDSDKVCVVSHVRNVMCNVISFNRL